MVQSYILENLQASCDKSLVRKKYLQIDWMIKNDEKVISLLGSNIKYAGQQQWLFSMVVTIKDGKEPQKTFQSLPYNAFVGLGAELFDINAMFANFWPTIIEDQCSSILLCQCTAQASMDFSAKILKNIKGWLLCWCPKLLVQLRKTELLGNGQLFSELLGSQFLIRPVWRKNST